MAKLVRLEERDGKVVLKCSGDASRICSGWDWDDARIFARDSTR